MDFQRALALVAAEKDAVIASLQSANAALQQRCVELEGVAASQAAEITRLQLDAADKTAALVKARASLDELSRQSDEVVNELRAHAEALELEVLRHKEEATAMRRQLLVQQQLARTGRSGSVAAGDISRASLDASDVESLAAEEERHEAPLGVTSNFERSLSSYHAAAAAAAAAATTGSAAPAGTSRKAADTAHSSAALQQAAFALASLNLEYGGGAGVPAAGAISTHAVPLLQGTVRQRVAERGPRRGGEANDVSEAVPAAAPPLASASEGTGSVSGGLSAGPRPPALNGGVAHTPLSRGFVAPVAPSIAAAAGTSVPAPALGPRPIPGMAGPPAPSQPHHHQMKPLSSFTHAPHHAPASAAIGGAPARLGGAPPAAAGVSSSSAAPPPTIKGLVNRAGIMPAGNAAGATAGNSHSAPSSNAPAPPLRQTPSLPPPSASGLAHAAAAAAAAAPQMGGTLFLNLPQPAQQPQMPAAAAKTTGLPGGGAGGRRGVPPGGASQPAPPPQQPQPLRPLAAVL